EGRRPPGASGAGAVSRLRIANCSGFFGDRLSAAREMVDGGPIDVLTGDWLAELTMLILARQRQRQPGGGYAGTFLRQMPDVLGAAGGVPGPGPGAGPKGGPDRWRPRPRRLRLGPA